MPNETALLPPMPEHTPGPWSWDRNHHGLYGDSGDPVLQHEPCEGMFLAYGPRQSANACLIAAAPDLLEALTAISPMWDNDNPLLTAYSAEIEVARAAIAKARGTI